MKQKDIALIAVIGIVSAAVSFLVSNKLFVTSDNRQQQVEVVDPINASFEKPNSKYFNAGSIDPTQSSAVGADSNQDPFNGR
jgi:hypothetical protein